MNKFYKVVMGIGVVVLSLSLGACSSNKEKDNMMANSGAMHSQDGYSGNTANSGYNDSPVIAGAGREQDSMRGSAARTVYYFGFNEDSLTEQAKRDLTAQAEQLRGRDTGIRLEGYADDVGSREYNMALSERRAKTVASYLQAQGISSSRIETIAYGEEKPAAEGTSDRARALNRRVELK